MKYCPACKNLNSDKASICDTCGTALSQSQASDTDTGYSDSASSQKPQGMKWFVFIIYVPLFLAPFLYVLYGFILLSGAQYGSYADRIYMYYNGLKVADILYGLSQLAMAVATIDVRNRLAYLREDAPKRYLQLLVANIAILLLYVMIASGIAKTNMFNSLMIVQLLVSFAEIVINGVYFKKRDMMFTR